MPTPNASLPQDYETSEYAEIGNIGEAVGFPWLRERSDVLEVHDLRKFKHARQADVDAQVKWTNGIIDDGDFKVDQWIGRTDNYLFEFGRIYHAPTDPRHCTQLGWSAKTPARRLWMYARFLKEIHEIYADDFRFALQHYTDNLRKNSRFQFVPTDSRKSTLTFLIPKEIVQCAKSFRCHDIPEYVEKYDPGWAKWRASLK